MNATDTPTALVTGASGGIGAPLCAEIAADGYDLVLSARREDPLTDLASTLEAEYGVQTTVITADLAEPGAAAGLFEAVQDAGIEVHTLANVAGVPVYGRFEDTSFEDELAMMQLNMVALTHLTKLFVRPMIERGEGAILNVSSIAAHPPMPRLAVYAATKAYVLSFSEAIAHELADEGVTVTTLCPTSVDTEVFEMAEMADVNLADPSSLSDPEMVASAAWEGVKNGERIVRPSLRAKVIPQAMRFLPWSTRTSMGASSTAKRSE